MRAVRVHDFGGPDRLIVEDIPDPQPGPSEVLVQIQAVGVNPVDAYVRAGTHSIRPSLPFIPGFDGAGIVLKTGTNVSRVAKNDRVYVVGAPGGTYAEQIICPEAHVHPLPPSLSFNEGAALGIPYTTAQRAVSQVARPRAGDSVLVRGASGGVGLAAVQLARASGALVIGTASSQQGRELITAQGADAAFDHEGPAFEQGIRDLTNGRGVDIIIEMLANQNLGNDLSLLALRGRVVVVGSRGAVEINPRELMTREAAVYGVFFFSLAAADLVGVQGELAAALSLGVARPIVADQFSLADAARAHEALFHSGSRGKLVLNPRL